MKSISKQQVVQSVDKNLDQVYQVSTMVSLLDGIY
ncbi:acetolactate decarboxylase, partial [Klebsiella pneumoniae]|nr:acetolactate decarboxylase [Klebsiella pneumoniae]